MIYRLDRERSASQAQLAQQMIALIVHSPTFIIT
jgi:hypothetical protein